MIQTPLLIVGAGAAGLKCAATYGAPCIVLERNKTPGLKILISGGGRCNFTNLHTGFENFISKNRSFTKSALSRYTPEDTLKWVEDAGIAFEEKHRGQMFCQKSSKEILNLLLNDCRQKDVQIKTNVHVKKIEKEKDFFKVETSDETFQSSALVVATGGLSYPRLGVSGLGYEVAEKWGHALVSPKPSLVSLSYTSQSKALYGHLSGISLPVRVLCKKVVFQEDLLLTHEGLSGPAILQISNTWDPGDPVKIDLLPDFDWEALFADPSLREKEILPALAKYLPKRLLHVLLKSLDLEGKKIKQIQKPIRIQIEGILSNWIVIPKKTGGWDKAEVTRGGVGVKEINSKDMQSKKVPGLYFIGEVLDVTGHLGGYNFQWAFASAHACGLALQKNISPLDYNLPDATKLIREDRDR